MPLVFFSVLRFSNRNHSNWFFAAKLSHPAGKKDSQTVLMQGAAQQGRTDQEFLGWQRFLCFLSQLVGGLEHVFIFPSIGCNHPN